MQHSPTIFDRRLLRARAARARAHGPATFLLERVAVDLADRLSAVLRQFPVAADIGTPDDALRRALAGRGGIETMLAVAPAAAGGAAGNSAGRGPPRIVADEELLPLGNATLNLAVSALALQGVNDLPGALAQIRRALKPDGLFLAALLGGETLHELRESFFAAEAEIEGGASPRVAPFLEVREAGALLQRAGFALPVADVERLTVRYASALALMHDLRAMGATNPLTERRRLPLRRATLFRAAQIYAERFSDADGKVRATFDVIWLSGWAPHESQQKPLAPGSARRRLADALGTSEMPAGDKPTR